MRSIALGFVLVLVLVTAARAEPPAKSPAVPKAADPLEVGLAKLFSAETLQVRVAAIPKILAAKPDVPALLGALGKGREYPEPGDPGWQVRSHVYPDGQTRAYHLYVPAKYSPKSPAALLFHMHGGVSRPAMLSREQMAGYRDWWKAQADEFGFFVVFPLGQQGCEWWTENAAVGIEGILGGLKGGYNVDEDLVFATGFSDGGSGAFYLALTHPTFFAGFIPLNGHPAVASRASKRQLYEVNSANRPLYVVNTQDDQLYRSADVLPFLRTMMLAGAPVRFTSYPGIGHQPAYRDEQNPLIAGWMHETPRTANPRSILFETADAEINRAAWFRVLELGVTKSETAFKDPNTMSPRGRVRIGFYIDQTHEGAGVKIQSVMPNSLAATLELQAGDVIVQIDDAHTRTRQELADALDMKEWGQKVRIAFVRDGDPQEASGTFPPFTPTPMFARGKPSGRAEVSAVENRIEVKTRGIKRYALDLSPDLFDFEQEIVVTTNGTESFRGVVKPDLKHLLTSFARDRDRKLLYLARVVVPVEQAR